MQLYGVSGTAHNTPDLQAEQKRNDLLLFIAIFIAVLSLTPLLILAGVKLGFGLLLGVIGALTAATFVVYKPSISLYLVVGSVTLIEQGMLPTHILTDQIYIFYWPRALEGLFERPIGFLFLLTFCALIFQRLLKRQHLLRGGALLLPLLCYIACVIYGVAHGLTSGGTLKIIVVEVRPFWYLFVSYLLAYNLTTSKQQVRSLFWIIILCAGIKGLQGCYVYFVVLKGNLAGHREIMAHEESFFFVALILLLMLFCFYHRYRPQLIASLLMLPGILIALIANQRRADYIALVLGIIVALVLMFITRPQARFKLLLLSLLGGVLVGGYVAAFYRSSGSFAAPARAVISVFQPDPRDASSNLYRLIENYDLKYTVRQNPFGLGFGKPFLQPKILPNILIEDPYYLYIPHNTIYWVWMRLGPLGFFALWYLFGVLIVRGSIIARQLHDPYLQLVAIYIVAVTFMEVTLAFADYQLFFYRNVIYFGLLAGILLRLPALDEEKKAVTHESARNHAQSALSHLGSQQSQLSATQSSHSPAHRLVDSHR